MQQGTVSWQYDRAQKHWAFEDFDNHTISTTPNGHDDHKGYKSHGYEHDDHKGYKSHGYRHDDHF